MKQPLFTAERSLYKTRRAFHSGRRAADVSALGRSVLSPAATNIETPGEVIVIHGEAPGSGWGMPSGWGAGGWDGPHGSSIPTGSGGGEVGGRGGTQPPPRKPPLTTLGQGPKYSSIRSFFRCESSGADLAECRSCDYVGPAGGSKQYSCVCYTCQPSSDLCTTFYDCTAAVSALGAFGMRMWRSCAAPSVRPRRHRDARRSHRDLRKGPGWTGSAVGVGTRRLGRSPRRNVLIGGGAGPGAGDGGADATRRPLPRTFDPQEGTKSDARRATTTLYGVGTYAGRIRRGPVGTA